MTNMCQQMILGYWDSNEITDNDDSIEDEWL